MARWRKIPARKGKRPPRIVCVRGGAACCGGPRRGPRLGERVGGGRVGEGGGSREKCGVRTGEGGEQGGMKD